MSDIPQASLGNTVPTKEFTQNYLSTLTDGNLIVFLQDKVRYINVINHKERK